MTLRNVPVHFIDDPSKAGSGSVTVLVLFRNNSVSDFVTVIHALGSVPAVCQKQLLHELYWFVESISFIIAALVKTS